MSTLSEQIAARKNEKKEEPAPVKAEAPKPKETITEE